MSDEKREWTAAQTAECMAEANRYLDAAMALLGAAETIQSQKLHIATVEAERDDLKARFALCVADEPTGVYQEGLAAGRREQAAEVDRLNAELATLGALKSAEIAPVIDRFREAFGADVPQAPSGKRALTFERAIQIGEKVHGLYPSEAAAVLLAEFGEPAKADPPVRHARHDRHCMIGDGVGCSHEPGCEVEP